MRTYKSIASKFITSSSKQLGEVLQSMTNLDLKTLSDAAEKGAVWLQRHGRGKILRERSLKLLLNDNDVVTLSYDPKILRIPNLTHAECVFENKHYGIWIKEAGVVPQGTQAGDHSSILRYVEKQKNAEVFLIHRLDRETRGLMIIGYTKEAAAKLSELFTKNKISKTYEAIVLGILKENLTINQPLDGKEAISHVEVLKMGHDRTYVKVNIQTGRLHQIRRHLDFIGHPIMGDPKYGKGNKNREGLKLAATELSFRDPWTQAPQSFSITSEFSIPVPPP